MQVSEYVKEALNLIKEDLANNNLRGVYATLGDESIEPEIIGQITKLLMDCGIDVPSEFEKLGYIPPFAFYGNKTYPPQWIEDDGDLNIPSSITEIGTEAFYSMGEAIRGVDLSGLLVGEYAFAFSKIDYLFVDSMTDIYTAAFSGSGVDLISVPNNMPKGQVDALIEAGFMNDYDDETKDINIDYYTP